MRKIILLIIFPILLYTVSCNYSDNSAILSGSISNLKSNQNIMLAIWSYGKPVTGTFPLLEKELGAALDNKTPNSFTWLTRSILNGQFTFVAFDDANKNLMFDKGEDATFYKKDPITITPQKHTVTGIDIIFGNTEIPWRNILDSEFKEFFGYLNDGNKGIFNMIHPIYYFDHYFFDYDRITSFLYNNYMTSTTSPNHINFTGYKGVFDTAQYKSYGLNGASVNGTWEMETPKGSLVDWFKENVTFNFLFDDYVPYIVRIDPVYMDAGITFKSPGDNSVNSESYKIKFMWVNTTKKISPVDHYNIKLQVFTTPTSCATDLYGSAVTEHEYQWSKPYEFYSSSNTNASIQTTYLPQNAGGGSFTFGQESGNKIIPFKFKTYNNGKKDFKFDSACLYKVTVWINEINNSDINGPFGSIYLVGVQRGIKK